MGRRRCGRERGSPEREPWDVWDMGGEKCSLTSSIQVLFSTFMHHIHTYIHACMHMATDNNITCPQAKDINRISVEQKTCVLLCQNVSKFQRVWSRKTTGMLLCLNSMGCGHTRLWEGIEQDSTLIKVSPNGHTSTLTKSWTRLHLDKGLT